MSQWHEMSAAVGEQQNLWPGEAFTYCQPDLEGDAVQPRDLSEGGGLGLGFSLRKFNELAWVRVHPCGLGFGVGGRVLSKVVRLQLVLVFLVGLASGPEAHPHGLRTASYLLL